MTHRTIHELAISYYRIYGFRKRKNQKRKIMRQAVSEAFFRYTEPTPSYDFRPGIGSGRSADWLNIGFRHYSISAQTVHKDMPQYTGEVIRQIVRTMRSNQGGWEFRKSFLDKLSRLPPCLSEPVYFDRGYREKFDREMTSNGGGIPADDHQQKWILYWKWNIEKAIAEDTYIQVCEELEKNPSKNISGYLASSIISWKENLLTGDYMGCSGSSWYAIVKSHPEKWEWFLSRAPKGQVLMDERGEEIQAQVFPHEREKAIHYQKMGWIETLRMNDSIFQKAKLGV